jgi:lysine-specific demethylase 8
MPKRAITYVGALPSEEANLYLGNGHQHTITHVDDVQNIQCVLEGSEDWVLLHPASKLILDPHLMKNPGHKDYSPSISEIDPTDVGGDPDLQSLQWWKANLSAGDCLYVPPAWWQQQTSNTERLLSVNLYVSYHDSMEEDGECIISGIYVRLLTVVG